METYFIRDTLVPGDGPSGGEKRVYLLAPGEQGALPETLHPVNSRGARFCKTESRRDRLRGTIVVPAREGGGSSAFGFAVTADAVAFEDGSGLAAAILKRLEREQRWKAPTVARFLCAFWEILTEDELHCLEDLGAGIDKLENAVLNGASGDIHRRIMALRKSVVRRVRYYTQMYDMLYAFLENDGGFFSREDLELLRLFRERMGRLREEGQALREECLQVWELFRAELDLRQNRIMKSLTVVTTVFLPLSLLVGWYGMNFAMPELGWRYGYPAVIVAGVVIVILTLWLCRRKKFW